MTHTLWSRASKRALIAVAVVGLAAGAAGATQSSNAEAYAQALLHGYRRKGPPPSPVHAPKPTTAPGPSDARSAAPGRGPRQGPVKPPASARERDPARARAIDCLTAAVYYEARGETPAGQAAVAQVVLNRTHRAGYPKGVCGVVYQRAPGGCQFSFVCNGAMHRAREHAAWTRSRHVAALALAGHVMTAVGRATCFHALPRRQARAAGVKLGHQVFYAAK